MKGANDIIHPRRSFKQLFCVGDEKSIKQAGLEGGLQKSGMRGIAWAYYLGPFRNGDVEDAKNNQFSIKPIHKAISENRIEYDSLVQHHIIDPRAAAQKEEDLSINNPLSQAVESPWAKFFQNAELERVINQDIERCYPDKDFFQDVKIREMMSRILFIYAKENARLSYRQGMHELLAPIIYLLHHERSTMTVDSSDSTVQLTEEEDKILFDLLNVCYVEHDAYYILKNLMKVTGEWFATNNNTKKVPAARTQSSSLIGDSEPPPEDLSAVVSKCRKIQHLLLKSRDPELYQHLERLQIEPQIYLLRWVRLLLGREFHLDDLLILWDSLFAYSSDLVLIDYLCLAMLSYIRSQLLDKDYTGCLTRLMKYPPVEDPKLFIEKAHILMQPPSLRSPPPTSTYQHPLSSDTSPPSNSGSSFNTNATFSSGQQYHPLSSSTSPPPYGASHPPRMKTYSNPASANTSPSARPPPPQLHRHSTSTSGHSDRSAEIANLHQEINRMKEMQMGVSQQLGQIVTTIQTALTDNPALSNIDELIIALAELKQTKDILNGHLPYTPPSSISSPSSSSSSSSPSAPTTNTVAPKNTQNVTVTTSAKSDNNSHPLQDDHEDDSSSSSSSFDPLGVGRG